MAGVNPNNQPRSRWSPRPWRVVRLSAALSFIALRSVASLWAEPGANATPNSCDDVVALPVTKASSRKQPEGETGGTSQRTRKCHIIPGHGACAPGSIYATLCPHSGGGGWDDDQNCSVIGRQAVGRWHVELSSSYLALETDRAKKTPTQITKCQRRG